MEKPIVVVIEILIILTLIFALRDLFKRKPKPKPSEDGVEDLSEGGAENPIISLPIAVMMLALFAIAYMEIRTFEEVATAQFPETIVLAALPIVFLTLVVDVRRFVPAIAKPVGWRTSVNQALDKALFWPSMTFFGYLLGIMAVTYLAGQLVALPMFVAIYLWRWGGFGWRTIVIYSAATAAVLYGFYGRVMHLLWHPSLLFG